MNDERPGEKCGSSIKSKIECIIIIVSEPPTTTTTTTTTPPPALIPVITGSSPGCWDDNPDAWGIHLSWDNNANTLYHSRAHQGGWAKYFIPESLVTSVKLKNRADCCGKSSEPGTMIAELSLVEN